MAYRALIGNRFIEVDLSEAVEFLMMGKKIKLKRPVPSESADLWPQVKAARYPRKDLRKVSRKPQTPKETSEQAAVIDWATKWCKLDGIDMLFAIPNGAFIAGRPHKCQHGQWCNGGYNHFALVQKLKNEGLKDGVFDLFLAVARHGFNGFFLEMKRKDGGTLSPEQQTWRIRAQEEGYKTVVCEGAEAAIKAISEYLRINE